MELSLVNAYYVQGITLEYYLFPHNVSMRIVSTILHRFKKFEIGLKSLEKLSII